MLTCLGGVPQNLRQRSETSRHMEVLHKKRATPIGAALVILSLQGLVQVLVHLLKETHRGQPTLIGANQQRQILGHVARFHRINDGFFQCLGETGQRRIAVQFARCLRPPVQA